MKKATHIFIDEYGNSSLNLEKEGVFSHFIYTAVERTDTESAGDSECAG